MKSLGEVLLEVLRRLDLPLPPAEPEDDDFSSWTDGDLDAESERLRSRLLQRPPPEEERELGRRFAELREEWCRRRESRCPHCGETDDVCCGLDACDGRRDDWRDEEGERAYDRHKEVES